MDEKDWGTLSAIAEAQGTELPGRGVAVAKKRKCGNCGKIGHNARTCKQEDEPIVRRTEVKPSKPRTSRKPREPRPAVTAPTPIDLPTPPRKVVSAEPKPILSLAERKLREQEGKQLIEATRLVYYARIERWLRNKHQILAHRVNSVDDLKKGSQLVFVETKPSLWGGREPVRHYRGKVSDFNKKTQRIQFKYQRDTAVYSTDVDMVLNLKVGGRCRYFLVYDGKSSS